MVLIVTIWFDLLHYTELTTTVAVIGVPPQAPVGVIVNVTVMGDSVVLVNAPEISPVPLAAMPVTESVLSLVHV